MAIVISRNFTSSEGMRSPGFQRSTQELPEKTILDIAYTM